MPLPDFPVIFYPIAVIAVIMTGIGKGGFGAAAGGFAVPMMTLAISPLEAAAIMLPILCVMDIFSVYHYRWKWSKTHLERLLPGAMLGIIIGWLLFSQLSENGIKLLVGLLAIQFVLYQIWAYLRKLPPRSGNGTKFAGFFWGTGTGFTSTIAHVGGPTFSMYILPLRPGKTTIVATASIFFLTLNYVKLVPYHFLGQLHTGNLFIALTLMPVALLGVYLGVWLHKRVSEKSFYLITFLLLSATGTKLCIDAVAKLI